MSTQPTSLDFMKRISFASCLTIGLDQTTTMLGMSTDMFLKRVSAGARVPHPKVDHFPELTVRVFKIPHKVSTVLFSAYNENCDSYIFPEDDTYDGKENEFPNDPTYNNGKPVRYTLGGAGNNTSLRPFVKKVDKLSLDQFAAELKEFDKKIDRIWGEVNKIVVIYENSRISYEPERIRIHGLDSVALKVLKDWKVARFNLSPNETKEGMPKFNGWQHYCEDTLKGFHKIIDSLETYDNSPK